MRTTIEINAKINLDELRDSLICDLTINELVDYVLSIGYDMDESNKYYNLLNKKLNKILHEDVKESIT